MRNCPRTIGVLSLLGAVLAFASTALGQGTIAYVRPETPISFGPVPGFESRSVDLNYDGLDDFTFESSMSSAVLPLRGHRILMLPEAPPDIGGFVQPLMAGTLISSELAQGGLVWFDGSGPVAGATLSACAWPFGCVGPWLGQTAYAGIELQFNGLTHYGWLRISHFEFSNGGALVDWAYETRPGVPILAGAVPEPSTWALLVGGGVLMVWFRRK
jgi:hypothetical protein